MKKILLSVLVGASAFAASAITVDQLTQWGGYAMEIPYGGADRGGGALWSNANIKVEKSGSGLKISGIMTGLVDDKGLTLTVNNYNSSSNSFTVNDEATLTKADGSFGASIYGLNKNYTYYSTQYGYYYDYSNTSLKCTVTQPDEYRYVITIPSCELASSTFNIQLNSIQIMVFKANAVATDICNGESRTYPIGYYENGNAIQILNLGNEGANYYVSASRYSMANNGFYRVEGSYDANDNITLASQYAFSTGVINVEKQKYNYSGYQDPWYQYYDGVKTWMFKGSDNNFASSKSTITGKRYDTGEISHIFNEKNHWVSDGGTVKTMSDAVLVTLDDYAVYSGSTYDDACTNTVITMKEGVDLTHAVELTIGTGDMDFAYANHTDADGTLHRQLILNALIHSRENTDYVKDYDLYVVPARLGSVDTWSDADHDHEKGHVNGYCIAKGISAESVSRAADDEIPVSIDLNTENGDEVPLLAEGANHNSFYLKANYSNANLHPTFHSLVSMPITTSVGEILGGSDVDIRVAGGEIVVSGAENVEVYTVSGTQVYAGGEGSVAVQPGMYVVKAGQTVKKVVVK